MTNFRWWRQLHWTEYGAELLELRFIFVGPVPSFNFGQGLPMALIPNKSIRLLITGLDAGSGSLVAIHH